MQRAPQILLGIKKSVDEDSRTGRFLLTGSADVMALPMVQDSLAGRIESFSLLPLASVEREANESTFLQHIFEGRPPEVVRLLKADALVSRVLQGGYPDAISRLTPTRCAAWYRAYAQSVSSRDVRDIADVRMPDTMLRMLTLLTVFASQLVNFSKLGETLRVSSKTSERYLRILEQLYLVKMLPPWSHNQLSRTAKSPKMHFLDSGLMASLQGLDAKHVARDRKRFGQCLECFVYAELAKLAGFLPYPVSLYHFRDQNGAYEVDFVLEGPGGTVVGIEVKAAASVNTKDFAGLRYLADAVGEQFVLGLVLYDHDEVLPFGNKLWAAPLSCLWA